MLLAEKFSVLFWFSVSKQNLKIEKFFSELHLGIWNRKDLVLRPFFPIDPILLSLSKRLPILGSIFFTPALFQEARPVRVFVWLGYFCL